MQEDETTNVGSSNATEAPVEPTDTTASAPADAGNTSDTAAETTVAPEVPTSEQSTETPAPAAPEMKATGPSGQSPAAAVANIGPAPVGRVIVQKTLKELEDELDGGVFASIEDFVKAHWEAEDANVQRLAMVLRMELTEVWDIVRSLGVKLPQGM